MAFVTSLQATNEDQRHFWCRNVMCSRWCAVQNKGIGLSCTLLFFKEIPPQRRYYSWSCICSFWRSYSWSANICGCKKWLIYPPGQEKYLTDRLGNLAYDLTSDDMNDKQQFPELAKASKPITVIQREGEVIFVPRYSLCCVLSL